MDFLNVLVFIASVLATPLLAISYVPQIVKNQRTKNVEDISLSFWVILSASLTCFVLLALESYLASGGWVMLFAQLLNLILALIVMVQVIVFSKKTKK